jgi:hypothetical protein
MNEIQELTRAGIITEIRDGISAVPFLESSSGNLDVSPDFFMEELMNNIRNEVLGFQDFLRKGKNNTIDFIKARILTLKEDVISNQVAINELECKLP